MTHGDVVIENDVWIGLDAVILSGVRIGNGAVIGARSVVTRDVDAYSIVAGNPARKIRDRFTRKQNRRSATDCLVELALREDSTLLTGITFW